jgi:hypothetical protein
VITLSGVVLSFNEHRSVKRAVRALFLDIELDEARKRLTELERTEVDEPPTPRELEKARNRVSTAKRLWKSLLDSVIAGG